MVAASWNGIRCFRRFCLALPGSHSKFTISSYSAATRGGNHSESRIVAKTTSDEGNLREGAGLTAKRLRGGFGLNRARARRSRSSRQSAMLYGSRETRRGTT